MEIADLRSKFTDSLEPPHLPASSLVCVKLYLDTN